jgi:hypothetical protein
MSLAGRVRAWLIANSPSALLEIAVNFILPLAVYRLVHARLGDVPTLMAAAAPPMLWAVFEFIRRRRIDALSLIVMAGIGLSLLGYLGGGGVKLLQLREHLVAGVIGLAFLVSAAIGKPLIYQLSRARIRRDEGGNAGWFEAIRESPVFRRTMMVMTLAWGFGLVSLSATACALVYALSLPQFMVVSPILSTGAILGLTAWSFWYARRRIGPLRMAFEGKA